MLARLVAVFGWLPAGWDAEPADGYALLAAHNETAKSVIENDLGPHISRALARASARHVSVPRAH